MSKHTKEHTLKIDTTEIDKKFWKKVKKEKELYFKNKKKGA
jgi:hypothetical protein